MIWTGETHKGCCEGDPPKGAALEGTSRLLNEFVSPMGKAAP